MGKHFGESIIAQVLVMKERGITHRAIAKEFVLLLLHKVHQLTLDTVQMLTKRWPQEGVRIT